MSTALTHRLIDGRAFAGGAARQRPRRGRGPAPARPGGRDRDGARRRRLRRLGLPAAHRPPRAAVGDRLAAGRHAGRRHVRRGRGQDRGARRRPRDHRASSSCGRCPATSTTRACSAPLPVLKDVEAQHPENAGLLALGMPRFVPSTPRRPSTCSTATWSRSGRDPRSAYDGLDLVLVGRSNNVGKPAAILGLQRNATVISAHKHTYEAGRLADAHPPARTSSSSRPASPA